MIPRFKNQYDWLSNFYKLTNPIVHEGIKYYSVEHFYVAMKTLDKEVRAKVAKHPLRGLKALGKTLELRPDWEDIKLDVMKEGLRQKFLNNFRLKRLLLKTGDLYLQEGNLWGDKFWGICLKTGNGKNHLGRLLMELREELKISKN